VLKKLLIHLSLLSILPAFAHSEAAFTSVNPSIDATDLYAFTSYETGREEFITIIANFNSQKIDGPNYSLFDPTAYYEIKIDNDGDAREEKTFRFKFSQDLVSKKGQLVTVSTEELAIPFINNGNFTALDSSNLGRTLSYQIEFINKKEAFKYQSAFNSRNIGKLLSNQTDDTKVFTMPEHNIGINSITDYDTYRETYIYDLDLPSKGCDETTRVFVGPRADTLTANFSGIYDLINTDLEQLENAATSQFLENTVLSIALEIPKSCLDLNEDNPVIGVWSAVSIPARQIIRNKPDFSKQKFITEKDFVQVSRLGNPLVNQFLIGYPDKDNYNTSIPRQDKKAKFENYFLYPSLAEIIETNTSLSAPNLFPRTDMEEVFLTGIASLNQLTTKKGNEARAAEYLRLNTATSPVASGSQNRLGVIGGDNAGFPNGRRPGDDVVDIFYRILMGVRLTDGTVAPSKDAVLTDGVLTNGSNFSSSFPYL